MSIKLNGGKYEFFMGLGGGGGGVLMCNRYGEAWRMFTGDKAVHALYSYALQLRELLEKAVEDGKAHMRRAEALEDELQVLEEELDFYERIALEGGEQK
jgi:hypothetical protein